VLVVEVAVVQVVEIMAPVEVVEVEVVLPTKILLQ
jgi:hypothetical protein